MTVQSAISSFAGFMVMLSLGLAHATGAADLTHPSWLWLTAFVGANLFQFGFTGFCPASRIFSGFGLKSAACPKTGSNS